MKNQLLSGDSALLKSAAKAALVLMVLALSGCPEPLPPITAVAQWARTVSTGSNVSNFNSSAVDAIGNVYAAGQIYGAGTYTFGTGVTATGPCNYANVLLVKYNSSGTAQWARTVSTGSSISIFYSVAADTSGNVYAAGMIYGTSTYTFGTGVTASVTYTINNVVLVKYNSVGVAQWARTVTTGPSSSQFSGVAVDSSGNVYAAGYIAGTGSYTFGPGVTAAGTYSGSNVVLVKYNSAGDAQWARTVTTGPSDSEFYGVAVDASGNLYAAGHIGGTDTYTFGTGVTAAGPSGNGHVLIVKYNSSGTAQWARTVTTGPSDSEFYGVAVDASGNVVAAGSIEGTDTYTFGTGVTATGTYIGYNVVLVKYNASGTALWARTVSTGSSYSNFYSAAVDASGNVYAAGRIFDTGTFTFGTGITAAGTTTGNNVVLVKYNSAGTSQWARTVTTGPSSSRFSGAGVDASGNVYAAGYIWGTGIFTFGTGVTAAGSAADGNVLLVKYSQ